MARDREAGDETEREHERRHEQHRPLEQPRQVDERGDEGEPERHRDERLAEARAAGDRRQVAVDELAERQLEHVGAAQAEGDDPDLQHRDDPDRRDEVHPLHDRRGSSSPRRHRSRKPSEPITQGEREEVEPAHDVLGPRRAARAVRLGRRRRRRRRRRTSTRRRRRGRRPRARASAPCTRRCGSGRTGATIESPSTPRGPAWLCPSCRAPRPTGTSRTGRTAAGRPSAPPRSSLPERRELVLQRRVRPAAAGTASAARRRATSARLTGAAPRRAARVAEDRRDVAVGEEHHREGDDHAAAKPDRSTTERGRKRARAGRARRARASSRPGGAGTPTGRRTTGSARARGTPCPETRTRSAWRAATSGDLQLAVSEAELRRAHRPSAPAPTRRARPCGSPSW